MALQIKVVSAQQQSKIVDLSNGAQFPVANGDTIKVVGKANVKTFRKGNDLIIKNAEGEEFTFKDFYAKSATPDETQLFSWDDDLGAQYEILSEQSTDKAAATIANDATTPATADVAGGSAGEASASGVQSGAVAGASTESMSATGLFGLGLLGAAVLAFAGSSGGGGGGGSAAPTPAVNKPPTGAVGIDGVVEENSTLTANTSALADADGLGSFSYQWQANGVNIPGATGSSYVLTQNEVGDVITVVVRYTDGLGTLESVTSGPTGFVVNVNNAPVAVDDNITAMESTLYTSVVSLIANDTDVDGPSKNAVAGTFTTAQGGSLVLAADGSYTYTPPAGFVGTDTVNYTVTDGTLTDIGTLTITVTTVNDPPIAVDDSITAMEDTLYTSVVSLIANDTDVDGPSKNAVAGTFTTAQGGTLVLASDGSYTYNPAANFFGTDTVNYTVTDGTLTDIGTLTITVTSVNDAPVAVDDSITAMEDTLYTSVVSLIANDTDVDGPSKNAVAGTFTTAQGGSLVLATNGSYTYTPPAGFVGTDTVNYTVTDGTLTDIGTLTITVTNVNDAPVAVNDGPLSTNEDIALNSINVLGNDTDADGDTLTVTTATALNGTVTINPNGTLNYTPTGNYNGADTISYTISDGNGGSSSATVAITVTAVNDAPTVANAIPDQTVANAAGGIEGTAYSFTFASNAFADVDIATNGQILTYTAVLEGGAALSTIGLAMNSTTGEISGTPTVAGTYNVVVTATDNGTNLPNLSVSDTFTLEIAPPATLRLLPGQLDGLVNLDARSQIVLAFSDNIVLADGQIKIMDDMNAAGWTLANSTSGETFQDTTNNDVIITIAGGAITDMTIGGISYTAVNGGVGITLAEVQKSITVSGNKLIISPAGNDNEFSNDWDFDWDFGANYHVELTAGVVKTTDLVLGNIAVSDATTVNFTTVTPVDNATGAASMKMAADGTLATSYIWHSAHVQDDTMGGLTYDFSGGAHALYVQANGGTTRTTTMTGKVTLKNLSFEGGAFTYDDLLYMDNSGRMTEATTDGLIGAGAWAGGTRTLSNSDGGSAQRILFDMTGFPLGAWPGSTSDTAFEDALRMNSNIIVFG